jgi:hypothetical protein
VVSSKLVNALESTFVELADKYMKGNRTGLEEETKSKVSTLVDEVK